jgi:hypothetical protein
MQGHWFHQDTSKEGFGQGFGFQAQDEALPAISSDEE